MPAAAHGQQWHGGYATLPSLAATAGMEAVLSLQEEDLLREGKQVLVAYNMKPKAGYNYLATAAHFPAESSTGTNVNVCTTDDFTKTVDAPAYYIDPEEEEMRIACSVMLFDGNFTDGRAMMCSFLTLTIGNNQGMGDGEYGKILTSISRHRTCASSTARLAASSACGAFSTGDMLNGGLVVGNIIKPNLGLRIKTFGEACYAFWQGGDFIKNDEPQGNQVYCQMNECIPWGEEEAAAETGSYLQCGDCCL
eukprot:CAMPEP_0171145488 /NCGR_PEP_ID=MMETSP0766_2-20121228/147086_1 /TAXON_ID=439317 /ORGANISM="Gambierdiscus australes, Strain CAWD 149" /LENGTH=250 /DNA_ID=CAMNT_0011609393 /DNA_START=94 /DNA_END=847 /DNA_ORIENTATION=+